MPYVLRANPSLPTVARVPAPYPCSCVAGAQRRKGGPGHLDAALAEAPAFRVCPAPMGDAP